MKRCAQCDREYDEGMRFCPDCGSPLLSAPAENAPVPETSSDEAQSMESRWPEPIFDPPASDASPAAAAPEESAIVPPPGPRRGVRRAGSTAFGPAGGPEGRQARAESKGKTDKTDSAGFRCAEAAPERRAAQLLAETPWSLAVHRPVRPAACFLADL